MIGAGGEDTYSGGAGDDWIVADTGTDSFDGGDGNDTADFRYTNSAVAIDLVSNPGEVILSIENLYTGGGSDTLSGSAAANYINAGNGHDLVDGREGNDNLVGGGGNDSLTGGDGNDTLEGAAGEDTYSGGTGDDWLVAETGTDSFDGGDGVDTGDFRYATTAVTIDLASNPGEVLLNVENLYSGSGSDALFGSSADNFIDGGAGNDTITGRDGKDTLSGGSGNDILTWDSDDTLVGDSGRDTLLYGASGTLDIDTAKASNIEVVNLGVGDDKDNGVALSLADVLDLASTASGSGLSANGDALDLLIYGDNAGPTVDNVDLSGGWTAAGAFTTSVLTGSSMTFNVYQAGGTQVAVQQGLDLLVA